MVPGEVVVSPAIFGETGMFFITHLPQELGHGPAFVCYYA